MKNPLQSVWRSVAAAMLVGSAALFGPGAQATTVTYTFTEFDGGDTVWQLRHSLDHFLNAGSFEVVLFDLADIVVDPWAAQGHHSVTIDNQGFGALPGFLTFNGAYFCNEADPNPASCDAGNSTFAVSFDMHVTDGTAGSWSAGNTRVDVVVTESEPGPGPLPEPGLPALMVSALGALYLTRPYSRLHDGVQARH